MTSTKKHWLDYATVGLLLIAALGGIAAAAGGIAAAIFTHQQVGIADQQVGVAKDTEKRQLRSYVGVSPGDAILQEGKPAVIEMSFRNFGQTPAHSVTLHASVQGLPYPLPPSFIFQDYSSKELLAEYLTVYPQSPYMASGEIPSMSSDQLRTLREGKAARIYAFGTVFYKDVFGDTHSTDFCYSVFFKEDGETAGEFCQRHNIGN